MPEVVLRNPAVELPYVVGVGDDGVVPSWLRDAGWEIDAETSPADARAEQPAAPAPEPVAPHFADDPVVPVGEDVAVDVDPEPVATEPLSSNAEPAPASLDLTKGN